MVGPGLRGPDMSSRRREGRGAGAPRPLWLLQGDLTVTAVGSPHETGSGWRLRLCPERCKEGWILFAICIM